MIIMIGVRGYMLTATYVAATMHMITSYVSTYIDKDSLCQVAIVNSKTKIYISVASL